MVNKIIDVNSLFLLLLNKPFINCGIITITCKITASKKTQIANFQPTKAPAAAIT